MTRLNFFVAVFGCAFAQFLVALVGIPGLTILAALVGIGMNIVFLVLRVQDTGKSMWWIITAFIPIVCLIWFFIPSAAKQA